MNGKNGKSQRIIVWATVSALVLAFTGCCCTRNEGKDGGTPHGTASVFDDTTPFPYDGGKIDPYVKLEIVLPKGDTTGSSGSLPVPIGLFSSGDNSQSCFPGNQGWNKFYVTFYFLGPNVSPLPNPNNYPNPDNLNSLTIHTLDPTNGTTLDTGIVILDNMDPTKKVCNDNATPAYTPNTNLSSATFSPTGVGRKYRASIYYKAPAPPGLSNIVFHWSYP